MSRRMGDILFGLACLGAMAAVIAGIFYLAVHNSPPCHGGWSFGGQTGTVTYHGKRIQCFHGDLVKVGR